MQNDILDLAILQDDRKELEGKINALEKERALLLKEFSERYPAFTVKAESAETCVNIRNEEHCYYSTLITLTLRT